MIHPTKLLLILYSTIIVALFLHSYLLSGAIGLSTIIIALVLLPFIWWIGKKYHTAYNDAEKLPQVKAALSKENDDKQLLHERKVMIEQAIDMVDDIAIYSLNKVTGEFYISKGAEQIYGYSHDELLNTPNLWKQVIHPEDKEKHEYNEQKLLLGESSKSEHRIIRPNGDIRWVIQRNTPLKNASGNVTNIIGNIIDISSRKRLETKLKQMAYYDELTDLANRTLLLRQLPKALARTKRHEHSLCIMFIDLDGFKKVNDTFGHEAGDLLLKEVAERLNIAVRDEDLIARLGGDEFVIVFEETNKQEAEAIAQRIIDKVSEPYLLEEKEANVSPSIGISLYPDDGEDQETLLNNADKAMYYAKSKGKSNFQFYSEDIPDLASKKTGFFEKIVNQIQVFVK